ncbi:hypothetical protein BZL41_01055 [Pseudomonas sp. PIC25]|nr:hypothetical protein BZL41_01055 [Pseudomonas sp. PIC25]
MELLPLEIPESMERAARALCEIKVSMDMASRRYIEQEYQNDWMDMGSSCAFWGDSFLRVVVPFLDWEEVQSERFQAYVDPRHVLGASINGKPQHVRDEDVASRIEHYSTDFTSSNRALYAWYKPLGILTAREGKHRVAFMRKHGDQPIAAWVRELAYPAAKRIQLIEPTKRQDEWFALLDGRYLQVLRRPRTSQALLGAYGVKSFRWEQLNNLPREDLVRESVYQRRLHKPQETTREADRTLDLQELCVVMSTTESADVRLNILMLDKVRFEALRYIRWPGSFLALGLISGALDFPQSTDISVGLLSAAFSMVFAPMLMEWRPRGE